MVRLCYFYPLLLPVLTVRNLYASVGCRKQLFTGIACWLVPALAFVAVIPTYAEAQSAQPAPSYQLRRFDQQKIQRYLQDDDYAYDRGNPQVEAPNLWQRFWMWVYDRIFRHLFREGTQEYWRWGIYAFCALVIGWAVLRLTGAHMGGLFYGKSRSAPMRVEENEANIHFIDFDKMISEAVQQGQYRRAVRLFYLKTLKQLSDRELIEWRPNKTNHDYLREWKRPDIEPGFKRLTFLFEYICYGDFRIDQARFEQTQREFQAFDEQIRKGA